MKKITVQSKLLLLFLLLPCGHCVADEKNTTRNWLFKAPLHLQLQAGFASETDFGPSLLFLSDRSIERTSYQGFSIGRTLGNSLFGYKAEIVGFLGLQNFYERGFQADSFGVTLYWKVYRRWAPSWWPSHLPLRFGLGQGISHAARIPVAEQRDFEPDQSAEGVHYLEWTLQVPVSGLLRPLGVNFPRGDNELWIGYSIFHRSTVFGLFADTGGGINYPGISIEYIFNK